MRERFAGWRLVAVCCDGGTTACNGACVDTLSSRDRCGACGRACVGGQVCAAG